MEIDRRIGDGMAARRREGVMPVTAFLPEAQGFIMILKSRRPLLLAAVLMLATPATFATAQAATHHHGESLSHRQAAQCGHMHGHARHSCEARVAHDWNRHHH
jgi:hypothetical protein